MCKKKLHVNFSLCYLSYVEIHQKKSNHIAQRFLNSLTGINHFGLRFVGHSPTSLRLNDAFHMGKLNKFR